MDDYKRTSGAQPHEGQTARPEESIPERAPSQDHTPELSPDDALNLRLAGEACTDVGNGRRLLARHGRDLIFVNGRGYFVWNGQRWLSDPGRLAVRRLAHQTAMAIENEARSVRMLRKRSDQAEELDRWQRTSQHSARIDAMLRETNPYIERSMEKLDAAHLLINSADGWTLELGNPPDGWKGHLDPPFVTARAPEREDLMTKAAGASCAPEADCPAWERFLSEALPDPALRGFARRWCGTLLTGSIEEQVVVICHGPAGTAISVFLEALQHVLGDYVATLPFASLTHGNRKRGSDATPDIARLQGARLVVSRESGGAQFSEKAIRQLASRGLLTARDIHQPFFDFQPSFKLLVSVGMLPQKRSQGYERWPQLVALPFENEIRTGPNDRQLPEILRAEAAGILNWMIDGYCDWRLNGLQISREVHRAPGKDLKVDRTVDRFLESCVRRKKSAESRATDLFSAYTAWLRHTGETGCSQSVFGRAMSDRGYERFKKGVMFYRDIELIGHPDDTSGSGNR